MTEKGDGLILAFPFDSFNGLCRLQARGETMAQTILEAAKAGFLS